MQPANLFESSKFYKCSSPHSNYILKFKLSVDSVYKDIQTPLINKIIIKP